MKAKITGRSNSRGTVLRAVAFAMLLAGVATAATSDAPREAIIHPLANANFKSVSDLACLGTAVEVGDPGSGPSSVLLKADKNCATSWHFHSAEEQLMVIKGELKIETGDLQTATLGPGGFALLPSKAKHRFTCSRKSECLWFLMMDRKFDSTSVEPRN